MWPNQNKRVFWYTLITTIQIMSWACETSRPLPHEVQGKPSKSLQGPLESKQGFKGMEMEGRLHEEVFKGLSTIGSKPPSCANKCGGCTPCEPTQVPTTTDHLGVQYANYEPEGWKCKCGPSFYNP